MSKKRNTPNPVRTVPKELHNIWLSNKRKKDSEKILALCLEANIKAGQKIYPASKPTVEKALLYGHCLDDNLRNLISQYFEDRNKEEKGQAQHLKQHS